MLTEEKQSGLPDTCWSLELSTIHTCLNRTSHLECSHLLHTLQIAVIWVPLTSRRPPCRASQVRPRSSWSTAALRPSCSHQGSHSRCARIGRQRLRGTCSARRTHPPFRHARTGTGPGTGPSLRLWLLWSIKASLPYHRSGQGSHAPSRPSLSLGDLGTHDTDIVLADSPSFFFTLHAPYSHRTFHPASPRLSGILTRISHIRSGWVGC